MRRFLPALLVLLSCRPNSDHLLREYATACRTNDVVRIGELTEPNVRVLIDRGRFTRDDTFVLVEEVLQHPLRRFRDQNVAAIIGWNTQAAGPQRPVLSAVVVGEGRVLHEYTRIREGDIPNTSTAWQVAAVPEWTFGMAINAREQAKYEAQLRTLDERLLERWFVHGEHDALDAIRDHIQK